MMKKVAILNGRIEHVYHDDKDKHVIENATIKELDMEYSIERGWYEVGKLPLPTDKERINMLENIILMMMEGQ